MSHPMWVRGLKRMEHTLDNVRIEVAPYVGAWIETCSALSLPVSAWSHPMWVRGLKLFGTLTSRRVSAVAPYVGAWIETNAISGAINSYYGRTLCGCVD